jgi:hypothetical protein
MKQSTPLTSVTDLSQVLIKILHQQDIDYLEQIANQTRLELKLKVPRLAVRHMIDLTTTLNLHNLDFKPDNSLRPDQFINQRKIFGLWQMGIYTYKQLEGLEFETFTEVVGGPQSRFFRQKKSREEWLTQHQLNLKQKPIKLPHLTEATNKILYTAGIKNLKQLSKLGEVDLVPILQPGWRSVEKIKPLTRARLTEIRYALYKEGLNYPFRPL